MQSFLFKYIVIFPQWSQIAELWGWLIFLQCRSFVSYCWQAQIKTPHCLYILLPPICSWWLVIALLISYAISKSAELIRKVFKSQRSPCWAHLLTKEPVFLLFWIFWADLEDNGEYTSKKRLYKNVAVITDTDQSTELDSSSKSSVYRHR